MKPAALLAVLLPLVACGADPTPAREPHAASPLEAHPATAPAPAPSGPGSSDGTTCEEARDANVEEIGMGDKGPADLTVAQLGAVLNNGRYLRECGVPDETRVAVCAAIKGGAVLGVTVSLTPASPELERCVAKAVRALSFPSHPRMDVIRTTF